MSKEKEIVDLVPKGDGTYEVKEEKSVQRKEIKRAKKLECDMSNMEQLFFGIDAGLEFMEGLLPRVKRISNLKKLVR